MNNHDVENKKPYIGAKVVFGGANRGASEIHVGLIEKLDPKSVVIVYYDKRWDCRTKQTYTKLTDCRRNAGCYYIVEEKQFE